MTMPPRASLVLAVLLTVAMPASADAQDRARPVDRHNVIVILTDDQGTADLHIFGDLMADEGIAFLRHNKDRPFFLCFAINEPHDPYHGDPRWLERCAAHTGRGSRDAWQMDLLERTNADERRLTEFGSPADGDYTGTIPSGNSHGGRVAGLGPGRSSADNVGGNGNGRGVPLRGIPGPDLANELVRFPLRGASRDAVRSGRALVERRGRSIPYQVVDSPRHDEEIIAFAVDLDPYQVRSYRFVAGPASTATDLRIEETPERIRLIGREAGISIRKAPKDGQGPVEAIRLGSGRWIGDSRLIGASLSAGYRLEVKARGPVFAEVACRTGSGPRSWRLGFRVQAGDPVIEVDEEFDLGPGNSLELSLGKGFAPDGILYRNGKSASGAAVGNLATCTIASGGAEPVFVLEPWLRWWERLRQGVWFGLYRVGGPDLLAIGACRASAWVNPADDRSHQSPPRLLVTGTGENVTLTLPLGKGRRNWLIAAVDRQSNLDPLRGKSLARAPQVQRRFIGHGDFPLDLVKDMVIDWPGDHDTYPRLFLKKADLPRLRNAFQADPAQLARYAREPISMYNLDEPFRYYFGTDDPALGKHLADAAVEHLQRAVRMYLDQDELMGPGFAPHHQNEVMIAAILADAVLGGGHLKPEMSRRMRAQLAFLGHVVDRADFWSPERGFSANPNMTTTIAAYRAAIACAIPSHPMAGSWIGHALDELRENELFHWSDSNGGWLEAPHYAMLSFDYLIGCFLMARNAGFSDDLYHPRMKKVGEWFAKISTPPDFRTAGTRHFPPIGNTYIGEPTGEFGILAYLWKHADPRFASEMQWMHRQHGARTTPGIGGFFPTLAGYRTILHDETIPAVAPAYGSEWFPRTGVVLRSGFPSGRETSLYMIAGRNHDHYDKDSGSVTLWGKGRIVADDFGYYGYVTGEDHSMVLSPSAPDIDLMTISEFATSARLDYVRGRKKSWTRQIAFIKDPDPLAANYFVFSDRVVPSDHVTWRLWLTAAKVTLEGPTASVEGREDVDTDVVFAWPERPDWRTETISRTSGSGISPTGQEGPTTTTQTGLIAKLGSGLGCTVVVYPRMKGRPRAAITSIADGKGVKVQSESGTDYVFLAPERFRFRQGDVDFDGTAGAILNRGSGTTLVLGSPGRIAMGASALESAHAAERQLDRR